ncbi:MAG: hypothetical protein QOJ99_499 [Bryobacterales bacterium]|nr:hypothetical protein [Bryobacterales bacterium]
MRYKTKIYPGIATAIILALPVYLPGFESALLASESFSGPVGALNGMAGGSGWAAPWQVQNNSTSTPGYEVASAAPLGYGGVSQFGNYGIGGLNWQTSGRTLDTSATGPFGFFLNNGLIGNTGQTLYVGLLMRMDRTSNDEISVTLHPGASPAWWVNTAGAAVGYFGGSPFWSLRLDGTVYRSTVPIVVGQAALLVARLEFGTTNWVRLFVNPPPDAMPATADVSASTTKSISFRSLAYNGGTGVNQSSIDEIRISGSYPALNSNSPAPPAAPTGLSAVPGDRQVTLNWNAVSGAVAYKILMGSQLQATVTGNSGVITGLINGSTYSFYIIASNSAGDSPASTAVTAVPRGAAPVPHPGVGTNLSQLTDYTRAWPFVDAFKIARPWISQMQGAAWGSGPALQQDANGWIEALQPGQFAETIIFDNALDDHANFPTGQYTLLYDGEGTIQFDLSSATIVSQTPGRMVVAVTSAPYGVFLMITATNPANPIRNIRFIMPGFESSYLAQPFHPLFLQRLQHYRVLRFMEWMLSNGSAVRNWADRAAPSDYTYSLRGVPLEVLIQLTSTLNVTPWFNIPAQASDDYLRQFATTVKTGLRPGAPFYLEYSNETWNTSFSQNGYIQQQGLNLGLSTDPTLAAAYYTAYRSVQMFTIFQSVLGSGAPMIRVIASQAANSWLSDQTLAFQNAFGSADALAIAPYFNCGGQGSGNLGILGDPATANQVTSMTVDQIIDIELAEVNGCALQEMQSNAAVAKKYGLELVGYEGGQSLVGFNGAENNSAMTLLFEQANRSPRMESVYTQYLQNWAASGGDVLVHFNDVGAFTEYGNWGALEYQDQDPNTAPKYRALMTFATQNP